MITNMQQPQRLVAEKSTIEKGETQGTAIYIGPGADLRAVCFETEDGQVSFTGSQLTFLASYDGTFWFSLNGYNGQPFTISTKVLSTFKPTPNGLPSAGAVLPIQPGGLFAGVLAIIPVSDRPEAENRELLFYK